MLVLSHFKGHPMGVRLRGALKQLSIGCASFLRLKGLYPRRRRASKDGPPTRQLPLDAMADAASSVAEYFKDKTVFINVMKNMSVDCDCCAVAEDSVHVADYRSCSPLDPIVK